MSTVVIINNPPPLPGVAEHASERVRRVVAALAESLGPEVTIRQTDIASAAGCRRETASRVLAQLERDGLTTQGRGRIVVHDLAALRSGGRPTKTARQEDHHHTVNSPAKESTYDA